MIFLLWIVYSNGTWDKLSNSSALHLGARPVLLWSPTWKPGTTFVFSPFIWSICSITLGMVSSDIWHWIVGCGCNVRRAVIILSQIFVACSDSYVMPIALLPGLSGFQHGWLSPSFLWNVEMFPAALCDYGDLFCFPEDWSVVFWNVCERGNCCYFPEQQLPIQSCFSLFLINKNCLGVLLLCNMESLCSNDLIDVLWAALQREAKHQVLSWR